VVGKPISVFPPLSWVLKKGKERKEKKERRN
jgi:hypothetical protein